MDLSNLTIRDFLANNCGDTMCFSHDESTDATVPRRRASSVLSSRGCDGALGDDDDCPLYESSTQVVNYLFENDDAPLMSEERADSTSSGYDVDKEFYENDGSSPTFLMSESPETSYDKVDPILSNGLIFGQEFVVPQRMETSFSSNSSYGDQGYYKSGLTARGNDDLAMTSKGNCVYGDIMYSGYYSDVDDSFNLTVGDKRCGSHELSYKPLNLLGREANKLMAHAYFNKRSYEQAGAVDDGGIYHRQLHINEFSPVMGEPSSAHGKNLLVNSEQQLPKLSSSGKKPPNLPNLVLNNLSGTNNSPYPYPYSNVAGAIKSPNPKDGLLGESPFHHVLPGMVPPGYVASPLGGYGVVAPGSATVHGRHTNQSYFQYPGHADPWMQNAAFFPMGSAYPNMGQIPFVMQKQMEKYPAVVPIDKASSSVVPDLSHGLLPLCGELDMYPGPNRLKKFAAVRHVRTCDKADQLENHVDIADYLLRCLEKERQQVEADLSRRYPGKRINSAPSATMTQYVAPGGNHTPLDRLIVDCTQEHTKVMTILGKIEGILGHPVHPDVREDIGDFKTGVVRMQNARKNEIQVATRLHDEGIAHAPAGAAAEFKAFDQLLSAVMDLQNRARAARTALYAAFASVVFKEIYPDLSDATFLPTAQFSRLVELGKERKRVEAMKGRKVKKMDMDRGYGLKKGARKLKEQNSYDTNETSDGDSTNGESKGLKELDEE